MEIHTPKKMEKKEKYPAMVFFFGGGWKSGSRSQFIQHAQYYADKGIVCFLADYRVEKSNNSTPFQSLADAKSAVRFIRKNAKEFQIDSDRLIASGGSAGGHLAAATALVEGYDDSNDDLSISCKPNALVLFNPVIDNGPGGYGFDRVSMEYKNFSPLHNIVKGAPPTIIFLGTKDHLIPVTTVEYYQHVMQKVKSTCVLKIYEGGKHGFFNYNKEDLHFYNETLNETNKFLKQEGYLTDLPPLLN
ncbi:alpha/beta hydrolase [Flammeovirga aprica JL-4]|uniref:Alpha/beta hydrolase n=1 Tax=Flammeovirga aprica JL-4 TaxID=694437 RepID=A0A7X9RQH1_9BACT|nr:alpha/beta hydrolase [Flammeovirga aprica JL-4]